MSGFPFIAAEKLQRRNVVKACELLEPLRPHDLRHTAVAMWIAAGANPLEVARRAGHTSTSFTQDRYGHLYEESDLDLRTCLDAMFAGGAAAKSGEVVRLPSIARR